MKFKVKETKIINGIVKISGSKNASLAIIAAALLSKKEIVLYNIPVIDDVIVLINIIKTLGVEVYFDQRKNKLTVNANILNCNVKTDLVSKLRASYYLMGALISRKKQMSINFPGGCNFVSRPIELHLKAFKDMNIDVKVSDKIQLKRKCKISTIIHFPIISVGATINSILASVLSNQKIIIKNASIEPEVIDTINFLNVMGANIIVNQGREIIIEGVKELNGGMYKVMFDRVEAGSYLFLAAAHPKSKLTLINVDITKMISVVEVLRKTGCSLKIYRNKVNIYSKKYSKGVSLQTGPYPLFPTDLQPILCSALFKLSSTSVVEDLVYIGRNSHIKELKKLNGNIYYKDNRIYINKSKLVGDIVCAHDLRCAFALIIAGTISRGMTLIENIDFIFRGYENIVDKLIKIGVDIEQVS